MDGTDLNFGRLERGLKKLKWIIETIKIIRLENLLQNIPGISRQRM